MSSHSHYVPLILQSSEEAHLVKMSCSVSAGSGHKLSAMIHFHKILLGASAMIYIPTRTDACRLTMGC